MVKERDLPFVRIGRKLLLDPIELPLSDPRKVLIDGRNLEQVIAGTRFMATTL